VKKRVAPSAALEAAIDELLSEGLGDAEQLAVVGRLGARLVIQRALEEEVANFLGRARYQRTEDARGSRNGVRPRRVQTAEGELEVQMPQLRDTADRFVSRVLPDVRTVLRTRPLEALILGAYVRGLSDRDIESLIQEAGLGKLSKSTASRVCQELRERYRAFRARSLAQVELLVLFMDAIYLPTRPSGAKEGVLVAWGYTETGERVLLDVCLGLRERYEDWLEMGRGLTRRGLRAPWLAVVDGALRLNKSVDELWPDSDRQRCTVHRLRNVIAKLPKRQDLQDRVRDAYWAALDQAGSAADGEARLVGELETDYPPQRPPWPRICQRSASTSAIRSGCASGYAAPTSWSALLERSSGAPRSSVASLARPAASVSAGGHGPGDRGRPGSRPHRFRAPATRSDARRQARPIRRRADRLRC
jgi:putative transposase